MSAIAASSIYTGVWINWSRGSILGATITLSQRNGSLLTAFLGIFVTITGGACWRILSFFVHQHRAEDDSKNKNALHHQQQVIFRNSDSSTVTAWQMIRLVWHHRTGGKKQISKNLVFVMLALCNTLLFAIAGVFSSAATKPANSEVLISSSRCDWPRYHIADNNSQYTAFITQGTNETHAAIMYARACYGDVSNELQCGRFLRSQLTSTSKMNVSCPFQSRICLEGPNAAFQIQSNWIDTNNDLGINSKTSDRLQYRKVTTCSVLKIADYISEDNFTDSNGNFMRMYRYNYGRSGIGNDTFSFNLYTLWATQGYVVR